MQHWRNVDVYSITKYALDSYKHSYIPIRFVHPYQCPLNLFSAKY